MRFPTAFAIALACSMPLQADEITDTLRDAIAAYEAGDIAEARDLTNFAGTLLTQARAGSLEDMLPEVDGWTKTLDEGASSGMGMIGGVGVVAEYRKDNEEVMFTIMTESPMMAAMMPMMSNSAMLAQMGKVKRVNGEKIVLSRDSGLMTIVDNRFMIQIEGLDDGEALLPFFEALDLEALKSF